MKSNQRTGSLLFGAFGLFLALISLGMGDLSYLYNSGGTEIV